MRYFETKVRVDRMSTNGQVKTVTETYAIAAQTFSDAEHKAYEVASQGAEGEVEVIAEKIAPYDQYIYTDTPKIEDKFYLVKYAIVTVNEFTGKEQTEYYYVLVEALDVESATEVFNRMPGDATCRELVGIRESKVVECISGL